MIEKRSMRIDEKESIRFSRWLHLQFILILLNDINDSDNEERINDNNDSKLDERSDHRGDSISFPRLFRSSIRPSPSFSDS